MATIKNNYYKKNKFSINKIIATIFMFSISIMILLPFLWMLSASFKRPADIFKFPIQWIPSYFYPDNYIYIFTNKTFDFLRMYFNSIKITTISVLGALIISILAAYGFSKVKFPGREKIFFLFILMMIIPNQVLMVPRFIIFQKLHIINTHTGIILPGFFVIMNTFLLRQFFVQIPDEIVESALIDGAGHLRICFQLMVPIAKPVITTFILVVSTVYWNDYEMPLVLLRSKELYTVPVGLAYFSMAMRYGATEFHYLMAGAAVSILPMVGLFLAGQKQFIEGLTSGAVKG